MQFKKKKHRNLSDYYVYSRAFGLPGCITVQGRISIIDNRIGLEMNILSRFIWGLGAAANSIYNAHGFAVKFQGKPEVNITRSKLLTAVWRFCKENDITISMGALRLKSSGRMAEHERTEDINKLKQILLSYKK